MQEKRKSVAVMCTPVSGEHSAKLLISSAPKMFRFICNLVTDVYKKGGLPLSHVSATELKQVAEGGGY